MKSINFNLIAILVALMFIFAACGGGGNDGGLDVPGDNGDAVIINSLGMVCADVDHDPAAICDAELMALYNIPADVQAKSGSAFPIGGAPTAIFNAGDFALTDYVYTVLEIDNQTPQHQRFCVDVEYVMEGCGQIVSQTYPDDVLPMQSWDFDTMGIQAGPCATAPADNQVIARIINGVGIVDNNLCDRIDGEVLFEAIINFHFSP